MTAVVRPHAMNSHRGNRSKAPSAIVRNSIALMTSTIAASVLGVVFWAAAARFSPPAQVGRASVLASSVTLLAGFAQLNLADMFLRFVPSAGRAAAKLLSRAYIAVCVVGVSIALIYIALGLGSNLLNGFGVDAIFVLAVTLFAIFAVQDAALVALRRAAWVPIENIACALLKLIMLPLFTYRAAGVGIFSAWVAPVLFAVLTVTALIFLRLVPEQARLSSGRGELPNPRSLAGFVTGQYIANVLGTTMSAAPTVLVAHWAGNVASAYFYPAWMIGTAPTLLLVNLVMSLVAESSRDSSQIRTHIHKTVKLGLLVTIGGALIMVAGARPLLLAMGGSTYADHGTVALRLIGVSLPLLGVLWMFRAFTLIVRHTWGAAAVQALMTVTFLAGSYFGLNHFGISGVGGAYLVAVGLAAAVTLPWSIRMYRSLTGKRVEPITISPDTTAVLAEYLSHGDTMVMSIRLPGRLYSSAARVASRVVDPNASTPTELMPLPLLTLEETQEIKISRIVTGNGSADETALMFFADSTPTEVINLPQQIADDVPLPANQPLGKVSNTGEADSVGTSRTVDGDRD